MSEQDSKSRPKRPSVSGALGRVLDQVRTDGFSTEKRATTGPSPLQAGGPGGNANAPRFYPTKGLAKVPPSVCRPWALADRPDSEFGHLPEVARSLKYDGQIQPAVVRVLNDPSHPSLRYEVIAGQVRWRAALEAGVDLEVTIRELDDEAAFRFMVGENEFRKNLSDYARAKRLERALHMGLYKDKASLAQSCGLSSPQLSYLLGFAELDPAIVGRFKNVAQVSARLGYALGGAVRDGYREDVLRDLEQIETGAIQRTQIPGIWAKPSGRTDAPMPILRRGVKPTQYRDDAGQVLFTLKASSETGPVLRFTKNAAPAVTEEFLIQLQRLLSTGLKGPK